MGAKKKYANEYGVEPLVTQEVVMNTYGFTESFMEKARYRLGLPYYKVAGVKFRLSEVEQWVQQRKGK